MAIKTVKVTHPIH